MARSATTEEAEVFRRLQSQIVKQQPRNRKRTLYADAEFALQSYGLQLPDGKMVEQTPSFWPGKSIDVFSSRLRPAGYAMSDATALAELEAALEEGSIQIKEQLAIKAALRHGPAFLFTSAGDVDAGEPAVVASVSSALAATAEMNRAGMVTAALELLGSRTANLYLPGRVLYVEQRIGRLIVLEEHDSSNRVLCAPYIHGQTVERPFGTSRITRPIMGLTDAGMRTFMRSEVSAEWYSYPRERLLGVDPGAFVDAPGWLHMIGGVQALPDIHPDDEPNYPDSLRRAQVHTVPQMSMQPFSDQMRLIGAQYSGASSIPPNYLGIIADSNPTSAQAIWAQEVDLVRAVEDQFPSFNIGRRALALNVLTVLYGDFDPREAAGLASQWQEPRTRSPLEQGQFVAQQVGAGNFQAGTRATLDLLPISPDAAKMHAEENRRASGGSLLDRLANRPAATVPEQAAPTAPAGSPVEDAAALKAKFEALGMAVRAGVDPEDAANRLGLGGIKMTGGVPVSLRMPENEAAALEER